MTLREAYQYYISLYKDRIEAVNKNYRYNMEKYVLKYIGMNEIETLLPSLINKVVGEMTGKGQTTINSVYNDLRFVLRNAYMDGLLDKDISTAIRKPKAKRGNGRRALTPAEREAVISVAQTNRMYYAFLFMILCGCRPSEAYAITREDIDFEEGTVHIRGTKTRASDRVVPCPSVILAIARNSLTGEITRSETGLKVSQECQKRIWKRFWASCHEYLGGQFYRNAPCDPYPFGRDLTAYNLRHEYCTELARRGVDIRITQKLMGHSSPDMTLKVYTNLSDLDVCSDELKKIINNIAWGSLQDDNNVI